MREWKVEMLRCNGWWVTLLRLKCNRVALRSWRVGAMKSLFVRHWYTIRWKVEKWKVEAFMRWMQRILFVTLHLIIFYLYLKKAYRYKQYILSIRKLLTWQCRWHCHQYTHDFRKCTDWGKLVYLTLPRQYILLCRGSISARKRLAFENWGCHL